MTKYMVFGWSDGTDSRTQPADEFLGTTSAPVAESKAVARDEEGYQRFGFSHVKMPVKTTEHILQGKERDMMVAIYYSHVGGVEAGRPFLAYLAIPNG